MPDPADYQGLHVGKKAADSADPNAVWFNDHVTGAMSLKPFLGATFLNELSQPTDEAPERIILATDYVDREPWVEQVGLRHVFAPAGPPSDPMAQVHNFPECDQLVFHMLDADYRYQVVQQPGRQSDGQVYYYYLADLVGRETATSHDTSAGFRKTADGFVPTAAGG